MIGNLKYPWTLKQVAVMPDTSITIKECSVIVISSERLMASKTNLTLSDLFGFLKRNKAEVESKIPVEAFSTRIR
ncbi:hypothetical protein E4413_06985 [Leptospira interrogans]|nr:hypothetical protein C5473_05160 [Leptospira interrogans serovar Weerasinghe]KAA1291912.1 hypothetical protein C4X99_17645 [Leptospira interrogans serovar Geyaweera]QCO37782.1 hypothetical protein E4412_11635 [Leptospira interrogans]QCO40679.1 hypothetical protein E4413_06985 [Leptospira interrogans]